MNGLLSRASLACLLVTAAFLGGLSSCDNRRQVTPECVDSGDCASEEGVLQACRRGSCKEIDCFSSADCAVGSYCDVDGDVGDDFSCVEGCQDEADCFAGERCELNSCVPYACRSTVLDCDFGEICNEGSGQCEQAPGAFCGACDGFGALSDNGGTPFSPCDDVPLGNTQCGGVGSFCLGDITSTFCAPACDPADAASCPAGFQCIGIVTDLTNGGTQCAGADSALQVGAGCVGDCSQW